MSEVKSVDAPITVMDSEDTWLEEQVKRNVWTGPFDRAVSVIDSIYNWGRRSSIWPMQFGLACCAIEMICTGGGRFDIARFGAELFRPSPRQADLMIVAGTVTKKMVPAIVRLYNQMAEPKYVLAMGACATAGGPFKEGYNVVSGIDKFLPVDVYVPGCPPTPQALLNGLITLQKKIDAQSVRAVPWYQAEQHEAMPEPVLGPDIYDPRRAREIKDFSSDPAKLEALYVQIVNRAELKHGKKEGEAEGTPAAKAAPAGKAPAAKTPAASVAKPTPAVKPTPAQASTPGSPAEAQAPAAETQLPISGKDVMPATVDQRAKEAPKETSIPQPAATKTDVTPPATKSDAGKGGEEVNPRTVNLAEPAQARPDAVAPITATRGEVKPIPANEPDKLMSERDQNPPGMKDAKNPALEGLPTATLQNQAKLEELKADADYAAKAEQIHRTLAHGGAQASDNALIIERGTDEEVRAAMDAAPPPKDELKELIAGAGESKDAQKKFDSEIGKADAAPEENKS